MIALRVFLPLVLLFTVSEVKLSSLDISGDDVGLYTDDDQQNPDDVPIDFTSDDPMPDYNIQ